MLFGVVYSPRPSPAATSGTLEPFTDWQPPVAFMDHWPFVTGGGMGLIEAESPAALTSAIAPFTPYFDFTLQQVDLVTDQFRPRQRHAR
jgi:Domain of unknown function (DUF3303)